jgi:ABC-type amino acid transport substrate-binding protein
MRFASRHVTAATSATLFLTIALLAGPALAAEPEGTLKKIKRTNTITLGHRESSRPFSFVGDDGKPAGYSVDLCMSVAASVGKELALPNLQVKWVKVTVENRMQAVTAGTIDLECGSTTASLSRQERVDFSNLTFADGGSLLATDASMIRGVSTLGGKRVAIIPGTTTEKGLAAALKKHTVTATMVPVKDHASGVAALDDGTADAYASDRVILIGVGRTSKNPAKLSLIDEYFTYEPYGLMLRRGDSAFRLSVNRTLASVYRSGEIVPIYQKWFGSMTTAGPILGAMYLLNGLPE